jgi:hypothetical protein
MADDIPDKPNFYSSLYTALSRRDVAELYRSLGWQIRKCSWTDYEISCSFAELLIKAEGPILMHGSVACVLENVETILAPLRTAEVGYSSECYGENGELLQEFKWREG